MKKDINAGEKKFKRTKNAVLIDVRTREEYDGGHLENSLHIPVDAMERVADVAADKAVPVYVYCRTGARSERAEKILKEMGYVAAENIGGITDYRGTVTKE